MDGSLLPSGSGEWLTANCLQCKRCSMKELKSLRSRSHRPL